MTTKNSEFVFNLQAFAIEQTAIGSSSSNITVGTGYESLTASETIVTGTTTDTIVTGSGTDTAVGSTEVTLTDTSWSTTYTFHAFNSTDTSQVLQITSDSSVATTIGAAPISSAPTAADTVKASVASPITITGGTDYAKDIILNGVGTLPGDLSNAANVALAASSGGKVNLTGVSGAPVTLTPATATFNQTINGAAVKAAVTAGTTNLVLESVSGGVGIAADSSVSLGGIDAAQKWFVGSDMLAYNRVGVVSANATVPVTVTGSSNSESSSDTYHLATTVEEGNSVRVTATGGSLQDSLEVNGIMLEGAAKLGAVVTATNASVLSVAANNAGSLASGLGKLGGSISSLSASGASTVNGANIVRAENLSSGATWALGYGLTDVTLGSDRAVFTAQGDTITADSTGNKIAGLGLSDSSTNVTLTANGDHNVSVKSSSGANVAVWNIDAPSEDASISAVFNQSGNLNANITNATVALSSSTGSKTLNAGSADSVVLANGGSAVISNGVISSVNAVEAGSAWTVKGGTGTRGVGLGSEYFTFSGATSDSVYGVLTTSSQSGAPVSSISGLSNNVAVSADTISGLNVAGTEWTIANPGYATFDSTGAVATVSGYNSDLSVTSASTDAKVHVSMTNTMTGTFNGVNVHLHDSDGSAIIALENATTGSGVAGITSLNSGATITGDNEYTINDTFNVHKDASNLANVNTQITLGSDSNMTVRNVVSGDSYSITGGTVYYDIYSTVYSGGTAAVAVNGAPVTISASTDSAVRNAYIVSKDSDAVVSVTGVRFNDTITTATDTTFGVSYNVSSIDRTQTDTSTPYTMNVNGVGISLVGAAIESSVNALSMAVIDSTANKPTVSISGGLAKNETVTVGAGYYIVGGNTAVEVNDSTGYLYVNSSGGVTAEDYSVAQNRIDREDELQAAVDTITNTVKAYSDFYNVDYGSAKSFPSTWTSTIAGYAAATTSSPTSTAATGGVNIYGDSSLGGHPQNVTLQSFIANPIKIDHTEGNSNGDMRTAVIDIANGNASMVAIGMDTIYPIFATNHTVLGSARTSTLAIGPQATGNNVVRGGNGGNRIYHITGNTGGVASLFGGTGSDTIYAGPADHVEGGTGKDYFFDSSAIEISDYNFDEGDVIIATKLSASANLSIDKLSLNGNRIAIADGATITVGSSDNYDEATATRAVIANSSYGLPNGNNNTDFLVWAGNYESNLDASNFTKGAMMLSYINGTRADTVTGSSYADTIYASSNDYINSGAGNDTISLYSNSNVNGASVVLSNGMNSVVGWQQGFDNTSGANVLIADPQSINFKTKNDEVVAYAENSSISFNGLTTIDGAYRFLVGNGTTTNKISYIAANQTASVNTNSDVGDYYKAERNGGLYVAPDVTTQFTASLGTAQFLNVTKMDMHNESRATVWGSSANETITANGSRDNGARKYVAAGDGNDVIISGGNSTVNAGNNLYFGTSGGTVFGGGRDTVQNFSFYRGSGIDPDMSGADLLYLGDFNNYSGVNVTSNQVEISLGEDKVIVRDEGGFSNSDNKIMRVQFDNSSAPVTNIKFGVSSSVNAFTYDGETDIYWGNTSRARDTLNVASELSNVSIWLNDKNYDTKTYGGIGVINATAVADTKLTLAGSAESNVIYAGGNNTSSSLWGGGGASNTLIGGSGEETFFYFKNIGYNDSDGNYHSSNDNIDRVDENDLIWLYDVTLNDIDYEKTQSGITNNKITVTLTDGTEIGVTNMSTNTNFRISNGQGGWTDVRAVNSGSNRHWE